MRPHPLVKKKGGTPVGSASRLCDNIRNDLREWREWCQISQLGVDDVDRHAEGFGDELDGEGGHIVHAAFYLGDVRALQSCPQRQFFLGHAVLLA